jgi:uncharacterized protein YecE (DUF72 family)
MQHASHTPGRVRLGLPAWAFPGWQGHYFRRGATPLTEYARVFDAVEGNTTFYRRPGRDRIDAWRDAVAGTEFRFCFKLPRTVTHEDRPDLDELDAFCREIERLGDHLGPLLIQFPDRFEPDRLDRMNAVVARLPDGRQHVLEVRHPVFFEQPERLEPLLERFGLGRVSMDTRALFGGDLDHPEVRAARHEKPDLPVLDRVYNELRFVRLVLHPSGQGNEAVMAAWAQRLAADVAAGRTVYMMIHCPNNLHCPPFARRFHDELRRRSATALPPLPDWPAGPAAEQPPLFPS